MTHQATDVTADDQIDLWHATGKRPGEERE